jgi:prophage antirepressor-like protein
MSILIFDYEETSVRSVVIDGKPWFVGKDVCRCLEIADHHQAIERLADDERGRYSVPTPSGSQDIKIVSEPGVYRLVFTSRTASAERFKRWIAHEVLPAIRKTGQFGISAQQISDDPIDDSAFDDLRKSAPILREWRLLYGKVAARRLALRLPIPQVVVDEMAADDGDEYTSSFCSEVLARVQGERASAADVYAAYLEWCQDNEARPITQTAFGRRLTDLGWTKERSSGRIFYTDVSLATHASRRVGHYPA